ncbi:MAG: hypothetical protein WC875_03095 [Candidatus Absconditabacterales bacterium]
MASNIEKSGNDKNIGIKDIQGFSIVEKEGKKFLHIILKEGEKIEIQISLHVKELYDILSTDNFKNINILDRLLQWLTEELNNQHKGYKIAWEIWLNLPENKDKKELIELKDPSIEQIMERLRITSEFSYDGENESSFKKEDMEILLELDTLLKVIDTDRKGLLLPAVKMLGIHSNPESEYGRKDIISKERIKEHLPTIEKLFKIFEKAAFSGENQRSWSQLNDDEKRILEREIRTPISEEKKESSTMDSHNEIIKYNNTLVKIGLRNEMERMFGNLSTLSRRFEEYEAIHQDTEISGDTAKIVNSSYKIYEKLLLLGLYYRNELYIKTKDGSQPFTGSEMAGKSIDGMLYYKQHQERYGNGKRYRFIIDADDGSEKDVRRPLIDLKIDDLSYGALDDIFALLGESGLAPAFSLILSNSLLPKLNEHQEGNPEVTTNKKRK